MSYRRIAVGVDLSPQSEVALRHAAALGHRFGAPVDMLHLVDAPDDLVLTYADLFREHRARIAERITELSDRYATAGLALSHDVVDGHPKSALARVASERGADLLVVGSHGYTGLRRMFLGSVAEESVRRSPIDVLVARPGRNIGHYERILVPTDFSPYADRALERAVTIATDDAEIDLIHCWSRPLPINVYEPSGGADLERLESEIQRAANESGEALIERYQRDRTTLRFEALLGSPRHAIADRAAGYDVVVMGSRGNRGIKRLVLGSVAEATVRHAPCSVYVTHG